MKGWFPRRCVKIADSHNSSDEGCKPGFSDSKTEQNSNTESTTESLNNGVNGRSPSLSTTLKSQSDGLISEPLSTESESTGGSGTASGAMPTFGARKRAKKPETDQKKI